MGSEILPNILLIGFVCCLVRGSHEALGSGTDIEREPTIISWKEFRESVEQVLFIHESYVGKSGAIKHPAQQLKIEEISVFVALVEERIDHLR